MSSIPGNGWTTNASVFQMHKRKTLAVPMSVHKINREKVAAIMRERGQSGVLFVQGGTTLNQYDSDTEHLFRQDSWFNYLFGTKEPDMFGAVDVATGKSTLFIPKLPEWWSIWCGVIHPPAYFQHLYAVDEVKFSEDIVPHLKTALESGAPLHILNGVNSDSGLKVAEVKFDGFAEFSSSVNTTAFYHALATARVTKSPTEVMLMHWCSLVASNAHVNVMRATRAGMAEYELEALFMGDIYKNGGCRRCAYTSICACGPNGATLHYGHAGAPNDRELEATDMVSRIHRLSVAKVYVVFMCYRHYLIWVLTTMAMSQTSPARYKFDTSGCSHL
jgi:Xaa-Pro dipeptidase